MRLALNDEKNLASKGLARFLASVGDACVQSEGIDGKMQAGLLLTDDAGMSELNRAHRGVDSPTDVLSFPSVSYPNGTAKDYQTKLRKEWDADTGRVHLGDIAISYERAKAQAERYGHFFLREMGFLFAHGMLHLMGYDHREERERAVMRAKEEEIMQYAGIVCEVSPEDRKMIDLAWEALQNAYAPYSEYLVGACVRDDQGRLFKGCNVENASYGVTICAERNAVATAVTEGMRKIKAIAVVSENRKMNTDHKAEYKADGFDLPSPCGACRQFMREFVTDPDDLKIILACREGAVITTLSALLPHSFGPASLKGHESPEGNEP